MKIALAIDNNQISQHFGHCQGFHVVEIEGNEISSEGFLENPGHRPGFLPQYLSEQGIKVIIAGGMGQMAQKLFVENGIDVITGARGSIKDTIDMYLKKELKSTNEVCRDHEHKDQCHSHN